MSNFENDIRDFFEDAEFQPSDRVWQGVEASLKSSKKKSIWFYWPYYGTAAAVLLVLGFLFLYPQNSTVNPVNTTLPEQLKQGPVQRIITDNDSSEVHNNINDLVEDPGNSTQADESGKPEGGNYRQVLASRDGNGTIADINNVTTLGSELILEDEQSLEFAIANAERKALSNYFEIPEMDQDISPELLVRRAMLKNTIASNYETENSLFGGMGSNVFNANPSQGSTVESLSSNYDAQLASRSVVANGSDEQIGALSFGVGMSFDLSERWFLSGGLRYSEYRFANYSNAYSDNNGVKKPIYEPVGYEEEGKIVFVADYGLTNTIKSGGAQALVGYRVLQFGKFDVSAKLGVGLDYFFSYQIKGDLPDLSIRKVDLDQTDFVKRLNTSGITGLDISYRINEQFGINAGASYQKFVQPSTNDEFAVTSRPSVFGFGLMLNYYLRR
ncbi:hypothetical protein [Roseivirga pacifica]|uniref:hypothetical protein n=1 Tax=Roseivirga pacifica TaxID=1267423 RepID=UPI003BAEC7A7